MSPEGGAMGIRGAKVEGLTFGHRPFRKVNCPDAVARPTNPLRILFTNPLRIGGAQVRGNSIRYPVSGQYPRSYPDRIPDSYPVSGQHSESIRTVHSH